MIYLILIVYTSNKNIIMVHSAPKIKHKKKRLLATLTTTHSERKKKNLSTSSLYLSVSYKMYVIRCIQMCWCTAPREIFFSSIFFDVCFLESKSSLTALSSRLGWKLVLYIDIFNSFTYTHLVWQAEQMNTKKNYRPSYCWTPPFGFRSWYHTTSLFFFFL